MKRYVIERDLPGAGALTTEQVREASRDSMMALTAPGAGIRLMRSHVTEDRIYCEFLAENAELVREHARRAGLPVTTVVEVARVSAPMSAMPQDR